MRSLSTLLMAVIALSVISCQGERGTENLNTELMEADRAFSEYSRSNGMNAAFEAYCHPEGVLLRPNSEPVEGRNQVIALLQENDDTGIELTWEPLFASAARSGDLGYTYGTFEMRIKATGDKQMGTYVSIWRKTAEGWKFVLDTGNEGLGR